MRGLLKQIGYKAGRRHIRTLMRRMWIDALYRRPNTRRKSKENQIFPYLLRKFPIVRSHQVWAADITYIPMHRGFAYLIVVLDWFSRRVLSWQLSNTLTTDFCHEVAEEAIDRYGRRLKDVCSEVAPFFGGASCTPARRAFEIPISITCFVDHAPSLPLRICSISSRTNSLSMRAGSLPHLRIPMRMLNRFFLPWVLLLGRFRPDRQTH
jgi:transposase InsO family protein